MSEVTLRPIHETDASRLFELVDRNRLRLAEFAWEASTTSVADSRSFITAMNTLEAENGAPTRGICLDEEIIGVSALHAIDWQRRSSQLGFWMDTAHAGQGLTTVATQLLVAEAFTTLGLEEVSISAGMTNQAPLQIARKLGFTLLGVTDTPTWEAAEPLETAVYSLRAPAFVQ